MSVLPDTSIWIDFFRGCAPAAAGVDRLLSDGALTICGPVLAELLAGTPVPQREDLWLALGSLPFADLDQAGWAEAGTVSHELRRRGHSVPLVDVAIAVAAVRAGATLWTRDDDFLRIAEALPRLGLYEAPDKRRA